MLKAIAAFCELVYDMMLLNVYWWRYMLLGGVLFSLIPATITVYDCIRKRILQKNEAPLKEIFQINIGTTNKKSLVSCCGYCSDWFCYWGSSHISE